MRTTRSRRIIPECFYLQGGKALACDVNDLGLFAGLRKIMKFRAGDRAAKLQPEIMNGSEKGLAKICQLYDCSFTHFGVHRLRAEVDRIIRRDLHQSPAATMGNDGVVKGAWPGSMR
jgi:hypothetical protein